jgi:hypothetical protein
MKEELMDFIRKAKQSTYASSFSIPKRTEGGGKKYTVTKGDWVYTDEYFGDLVDSGQERVYEKGVLIWVMAYRGGLYSLRDNPFEDVEEDNMANEAFDFLKKCLKEAPAEFPARGPEKFIQGDFVYENKWEGEIDSFVGTEFIHFKNEKVCFRNYLGGMVVNAQ